MPIIILAVFGTLLAVGVMAAPKTIHGKIQFLSKLPAKIASKLHIILILISFILVGCCNGTLPEPQYRYEVPEEHKEACAKCIVDVIKAANPISSGSIIAAERAAGATCFEIYKKRIEASSVKLEPASLLSTRDTTLYGNAYLPAFVWTR